MLFIVSYIIRVAANQQYEFDVYPNQLLKLLNQTEWCRVWTTTVGIWSNSYLTIYIIILPINIVISIYYDMSCIIGTCVVHNEGQSISKKIFSDREYIINIAIKYLSVVPYQCFSPMIKLKSNTGRKMNATYRF